MSNGAGYIEESLRVQGIKTLETAITVGEVIDTNDPMQNGRLRVLCPSFGDTETMEVANIPWAIYAAPFAGTNEYGTRGVGEDKTTGPVAYGMWNIPKVGARVLVFCIDGDPSNRVWFGSIYKPYLTHTLPHGRYLYDENNPNKPEGPLSSTESPINPLYNNQTEAFSGGAAPPRRNFEWRTRGADNQASFVKNEYLNRPKRSEISKKADDRNIQFQEADGNTITSNQGYGESRIEPYLDVPATDGVNWDPQTYSWTTPGFHSLSMSDKSDNCRIRFRTTGGTQIILDDTNERIYISTSKGKSWIEIDEQGPIAIYTSQDFSVSADRDINFTTKGSFRVTANEGIHLTSSQGDVRVTSGNSLQLKSVGDLNIQSGDDVNILTGNNVQINATSTLHLLGGNEVRVSAEQTLHLLSNGSNVLISSGGQIHLNGPQAGPAEPAEPAVDGFLTSMVPAHEPFARTYMSLDADQDSGSTHTPEYPYDSRNVGRGSEQRGIMLVRNPKWHR